MKEILDKIKRFLSEWLWQLPQNILGLIVKVAISNYISDVLPVKRKEKSNFEIIFMEIKGGLSLGRYLFVNKDSLMRDFTVKHEYGHRLQSIMLGPLYLVIVGLPSLLWALLHRAIAPGVSYYWFYTEKWANKLGRVDY